MQMRPDRIFKNGKINYFLELGRVLRGKGFPLLLANALLNRYFIIEIIYLIKEGKGFSSIFEAVIRL